MTSLRRLLLGALLLGALGAPAAHADIVYKCQDGNLCLAGDDGSDPVKITQDGKTANYFNPSRSADGRTLAAHTNDGTVIIDLATRQPIAKLGGEYAFDLRISPDGKYLADITGSCDCAFHSVASVYPISNPGARITDSQEQPVPRGIAFGPDGRLYTTQPDGSGGSTICRRGVGQAACDKLIAAVPGQYLTGLDISPDNTKVVVGSALVGSSNGPISIYDLATGKLVKQLTNGDTDADPVWTRDSKRVVFTRGTFPQRGLYEVPAAGGTPELLVPEASQAAVGKDIEVKDEGLKGFSAKADGAGVAVKVLVPTSGSEVRITLADGLGKTVAKDDVAAGKRNYRIALTKKARKKLAKKGSLKVTVKVAVTPANGGQSASESKTLTLKD